MKILVAIKCQTKFKHIASNQIINSGSITRTLNCFDVIVCKMARIIAVRCCRLAISLDIITTNIEHVFIIL